jgi:hypothetical protein
MLSNELASAVAPFKLMMNKGALSPSYRCLVLQPDQIRGASNYAVLEVDVDLGLGGKTLCVDASNFLAIIASLPEKKEIILTGGDRVLSWACGAAKGRLALMPEIKVASIEAPADKRRAWQPQPPFREALELGTLSAGSDSMASAGLHGVVIDNRNKLRVLACDGVTVSDAIVLDKPLKNWPPMVTISPDGAALLHFLLRDKKLSVSCDEKAIHASGTGFRALIKQVAPLKHDIASLLGSYQEAEIVVEIPSDRIAAFIKRVSAIAEIKKGVQVTVSASEGRMTLAFLEGAASADEYYLVDGLKVPDLPEVLIDASKMARALSHATEIVLDHAARSVIILRGLGSDRNEADEVCAFSYLISGRK